MEQSVKNARPVRRMAARSDRGTPWLVTWKTPQSRQALAMDSTVEARRVGSKNDRSMRGIFRGSVGV